VAGYYITPPLHSTTSHRDKMACRSTYCFTYNNYTEDGVTKLKEWLTQSVKYACFQKEVAPTTGTPHIQGYLNLKKQARMTTLQKKLGTYAIPLTLINANGTAAQNRTYCSKEGGSDFWEIGEINIVGQGKRTDLKIVAEKVLGKRKLKEIAAEHPVEFIKYSRGISALIDIVDESPKERDMDIVLFFGDARTGKSTKARMYAQLYGECYNLAIPNGGVVWFDGYHGENTLLIDEFKGWISPAYLNQLLDRYQLKLPVKGGFVNAKFTHIFITSNFPPEDWWSEKVVWCKEALYGRLTAIYEYRGTSHVDATIKKLK